MTTTTWYRPEHTREIRTCAGSHCDKPSVGRTRYFNGSQYRYLYQCAQHLPSVGMSFPWSSGGDES